LRFCLAATSVSVHCHGCRVSQLDIEFYPPYGAGHHHHQSEVIVEPSTPVISASSTPVIATSSAPEATTQRQNTSGRVRGPNTPVPTSAATPAAKSAAFLPRSPSDSGRVRDPNRRLMMWNRATRGGGSVAAATAGTAATSSPPSPSGGPSGSPIESPSGSLNGGPSGNPSGSLSGSPWDSGRVRDPNRRLMMWNRATRAGGDATAASGAAGAGAAGTYHSPTMSRSSSSGSYRIGGVATTLPPAVSAIGNVSYDEDCYYCQAVPTATTGTNNGVATIAWITRCFCRRTSQLAAATMAGESKNVGGTATSTASTTRECVSAAAAQGSSSGAHFDCLHVTQECMTQEGVIQEGVTQEGVIQEGVSQEGVTREGVCKEGVTHNAPTRGCSFGPFQVAQSYTQECNNSTRDSTYGSSDNNSTSALNASTSVGENTNANPTTVPMQMLAGFQESNPHVQLQRYQPAGAAETCVCVSPAIRPHPPAPFPRSMSESVPRHASFECAACSADITRTVSSSASTCSGRFLSPSSGSLSAPSSASTPVASLSASSSASSFGSFSACAIGPASPTLGRLEEGAEAGVFAWAARQRIAAHAKQQSVLSLQSDIASHMFVRRQTVLAAKGGLVEGLSTS
ncbi:hypothetical protein CLOM_g8366, partial [Closterium sp. NIES-68]